MEDNVDFDEFQGMEDIELTEFEMEVLEAVSKAYSIRSEFFGFDDETVGDIDIPTELIAICMDSIECIPTNDQRKAIDDAMDVLIEKEYSIQFIGERGVCVMSGPYIMADTFEARKNSSPKEHIYRIYTVSEKPFLCLTDEEREKFIEKHAADMDDEED